MSTYLQYVIPCCSSNVAAEYTARMVAKSTELEAAQARVAAVGVSCVKRVPLLSSQPAAVSTHTLRLFVQNVNLDLLLQLLRLR